MKNSDHRANKLIHLLSELDNDRAFNRPINIETVGEILDLLRSATLDPAINNETIGMIFFADGSTLKSNQDY